MRNNLLFKSSLAALTMASLVAGATQTKAISGDVNFEVSVDSTIGMTIHSNSDGDITYGENISGTTPFGTSSASTKILPSSINQSMWSEITVYTNDVNGYKLTVSDSDSITSLMSNANWIPANASIEAGTSAWALKGGLLNSYQAIQPNGFETLVNSSDKATNNGHQTTITYGVSTSSDQATGTYSDTIIYTATSNSVLSSGKENISTVYGTGLNLGDEFCIGEECFYTILNDGANVTALAKYSIYAGNTGTGEIAKTDPKYAKQDNTNSSYSYFAGDATTFDYIWSGGPIDGQERSLSYPYYVDICFEDWWQDKDSTSRCDYIDEYYQFISPQYLRDQSNYRSWVYSDKSFVKTYVDDYVDYLKNTYQINVVGRLATIMEIDVLANSQNFIDNRDDYDENDDSTSYPFWTGDASNFGNIYYAWNSDLDMDYSWGNDYQMNTRPVITIPTELFN